MTKNFLRSLAIAALACTGATAVQAQTVLQLSYPSTAPGAVPCLYTTNGSGISADPQTGNLLATGDFTTGCPQTGSALPLPVIVPGPATWQLPNPWAVGQVTPVQWAAVNAETCTYGGSAATGWPSGQVACSSLQSCQTLHDVSLSPPTAGQYQLSLTCSNATGSVTSTSQFRNVAANPPVITAGPVTWNVLPWTAGQQKAVQWSANNADSCSFSQTTLPAGVTLGEFLSAGATSCSNTGTCQQPNSLILNATVPGTYGVTLQCTNSGGGIATSTQSWNVSQSSSSNCLNPAPGWNRIETGEVFINAVGGSAGFHDLTQFDSIWGRNYAMTGYPVTTQWPGLGNQLVMPRIGINQYVSAKFRTPTSGTHGLSHKLDGTSYQLSGGDGVNQLARVSMTVSTVCGDFNTSSPNIPPGCTYNQGTGGGTFNVHVSNSGPVCQLQPNTDYFFNVIYAPLTSPASAVFNGFNGLYEVTFLQSLGIF